MYMVVFTVHLDQGCLKVQAYLGEHSPKAFNSSAIEHPIAVFSDKDQMDVHCENTVPTVRKFLTLTHRPSILKNEGRVK